MKFLIAITLALFVGICSGSEEYCSDSVTTSCNSGISANNLNCDSIFGGIQHVGVDVQKFINLQLTKSYQYLLLATHFNSYQKDRPGFQKIYQGLSDRSFDNTIDLIKQLTRRGGKVNFNSEFKEISSPKVDVDELHSLAIALDTEKTITKHANQLHFHTMHSRKEQNKVSTSTEPHSYYDAEMGHYMEEKFLKPQADTIRKLSGYANDLGKIMAGGKDKLGLGVYLFDEYLQKQ